MELHPLIMNQHRCHVEVGHVLEYWCCNHNRCDDCLPGSHPHHSRLQRQSPKTEREGRRGSNSRSIASSAKSNASSSSTIRRSREEERERERLQEMVEKLGRVRLRELDGKGRKTGELVGD